MAAYIRRRDRCGQTLGEIIIPHRKMPKKHGNANQSVASSKFYNKYYTQLLYNISNYANPYNTDSVPLYTPSSLLAACIHAVMSLLLMI